MIDTIFIEQEILDYERTKAVLSKFPRSRRIIISRYQEVFNKRTQNFRLQKKQPALILASKHKNLCCQLQQALELVRKKTSIFRICITVSTTVDTVFFKGCIHRQIMYCS